MTTDDERWNADWKSVLGEILLAFPTMTSDADRIAYLRRRFKEWKTPADDIRQGLSEYLKTGERFVETAQFVAIVNRITRQRVEGGALVQRAAERQARLQQERQMSEFWKTVDAAIDQLDDEKLNEMKEIVLPKLAPAAAEMVKDRSPRNSIILKGWIAKELGIVEPEFEEAASA